MYKISTTPSYYWITPRFAQRLESWKILLELSISWIHLVSPAHGRSRCYTQHILHIHSLCLQCISDMHTVSTHNVFYVYALFQGVSYDLAARHVVAGRGKRGLILKGLCLWLSRKAGVYRWKRALSVSLPWCGGCFKSTENTEFRLRNYSLIWSCRD